MTTQKTKRKIENGAFARGFTLVEVLAAITLMAIVLPTLMYGISLSANLAGTARHRTEATTLAEEKLNELVGSNTWQNGGGGDFGLDNPGYRWQATTTPWTDPDLTEQNLEQVDVTVTWTARRRNQSVTVSTLMYVPATADSTGGL